MSFISSLQRIASDWVRDRRAAYTVRTLSELPAEIRKDIGWPADQAGARRSASGAWSTAR